MQYILRPESVVFSTIYASPVKTTRLKSSILSLVVHAVLLGLLLVSPYLLPKASEVRLLRRPESVPLYFAQQIHVPKIVAPRPVRVERPPVRKEALVAPIVRKPKVAPPLLAPAPQIIAAAPPAPPAIDKHPVTPQPPVETAVKRPVVTEMFSNTQKSMPEERRLDTKVGTFGDVNGVKPSDSKATSQLARVGGFDSQGSGTSGHQGGNGQRASYQPTSFGGGGGTAGNGPGGNGRGAVSTGGFGAAYGNSRGQSDARAKAPEPKVTPVEIIAKPKPEYTAEARALKVEGDVLVEVMFLESGGVRVIRVVRGLGHGLDEVAQHVARDIQFRPGTRDGVPVDTKAIIRVTFELS